MKGRGGALLREKVRDYLSACWEEYARTLWGCLFEVQSDYERIHVLSWWHAKFWTIWRLKQMIKLWVVRLASVFMALGLANSLELSWSISLNDVLNTMVTMFGRWWRLHLQSLLSLLMKPRFVSFPWLFFYALRFFQVLFIDPLCRTSPFHTLILSILVAVGQWSWRQWIGNASGSCPILLEIQCRAIEDPPRGGRLWGGYHTSFKIPSFLSKYLVVMGSWPRFHLAQPC